MKLYTCRPVTVHTIVRILIDDTPEADERNSNPELIVKMLNKGLKMHSVNHL